LGCFGANVLLKTNSSAHFDFYGFGCAFRGMGARGVTELGAAFNVPNTMKHGTKPWDVLSCFLSAKVGSSASHINKNTPEGLHIFQTLQLIGIRISSKLKHYGIRIP